MIACERADRCREGPRDLYLLGLVFKIKAQERHRAGGSALGPLCCPPQVVSLSRQAPLHIGLGRENLQRKGFCYRLVWFSVSSVLFVWLGFFVCFLDIWVVIFES